MSKAITKVRQPIDRVPSLTGYHFDFIDSMVAHYKMNDNAATSDVVDATGNGHTGTLTDHVSGPINTSTATVAGKINTALFIDGPTQEYIGIPNHADFAFSGQDFSIAFWTNPTTAVGAKGILAKATDGADQDWIILQVGTNIYMSLGIGPADTIFGADVLTVGIWQHLVITKKGDDYTMYLNGVVVDTDTSSKTWDDTSDLCIGCYYPGTAPIESAMDDVRIFNKPLTRSDVRALYNFEDGTEEESGNTDSALVMSALNKKVANSAKDYALGNDGIEVTDVMWDDVGGTFNGSTSWVDMGDTTILDGETEFSVETWIWIDSSQVEGSYAGIITKYSNDGNNRAFVLALDIGASKIGLIMNDGINTKADNQFTDTPYPVDQWIHLVATWKGNPKNLDIYINGVEVASTYSFLGVPPVAFPAVTGHFAIGAYYDAGTVPDFLFAGKIKGVNLYKEVLHEDDIKYNYRLGVPEEGIAISILDGTEDLSVNKLAIAPMGDAIVGNEMEFSGAGYIDTGSTFQEVMRASYSLSFWSKPDDGHPAVAEMWYGQSDTTGRDWMWLWHLDTGVLRVDWEVNNFRARLQTAALPDGPQPWRHFVATYDSTIDGPGGANLYIDGEFVISASTFGMVFANYGPHVNVYLGAFNAEATGDTSNFNGKLKDYKVQSGVWSPAYVKNYYERTKKFY